MSNQTFVLNLDAANAWVPVDVDVGGMNVPEGRCVDVIGQAFSFPLQRSSQLLLPVSY